MDYIVAEPMSIRQPACLALLLSLVSCTKAAAPTGSNAAGSTSPGNTGAAAATATPTSSEPSDQNVASGEPSLVSLSSGAFPVKRATEWSGNFSAVRLLDENATSTWTTADGRVKPQATIALPEKTVLKTLTFDCTISPRNQDLSERRAASVKNYLQAAGVQAPRLKTAGYGATRPVASNDTELGRAQNRAWSWRSNDA